MRKIIFAAVLVLCLGVGWWLRSYYSDPGRAELRRLDRARREARTSYDKLWRTPILFYGKVVDEKGTPVAEANVHVSVTDESAEGRTVYQRRSDMRGLFTLTGIKGKHFHVEILKDGYYDRTFSRYEDPEYKLQASFEYTTSGPDFVVDPNNPIVFRLRKKREAASLIYGAVTFKPVPLDGTPIEVDLRRQKTVSAGQGDVIIQCWAPDKGKSNRYEWRCRFTMSEGGLIEAPGAYPFEAPAEGYRQFDEFKMPAEGINGRWLGDVDRRYYLKLRDGNYALMDFSMVTGGERFFMLSLYLNPTGSRNLERDPR